jgi:hypothetical protein
MAAKMESEGQTSEARFAEYVGSGGGSASKIFYVDTLATTIRAISGLSRQTPSLRMTKSAGSKT